MQNELDSARRDKELGESGEHAAGRADVAHVGVAGPCPHDAPYRTPDGVDDGVVSDQSIGQAFDAGTGTDVVDQVDRGVVKFPDHHGHLEAGGGLADRDRLRRGCLAESAADSEALLDDGVQPFGRWR